MAKKADSSSDEIVVKHRDRQGNRAVHYHDATFKSATGEAKREAYHKAYMPAFAEAFPNLLARALAKHDKAVRD